ncbi:hypothetical protein [Noviherbaspirillum sp.]|uniref:hypothetical protein n=1 Tax=Noviherbaspirillum sp. TaxID=1926288 RepID=UPI002FE2E4B1
MKLPHILILATASLAFAFPAHAQSDAEKKAEKAAAKKAPAKKAAPKADAAATDDDDQEPDVASSASTEYDCELGNKLTIFRNQEDNKHIALRYKKQLRRMTRVETTTGANRFENLKNGWVWIDIPAKGMLLDSKKGQQLANECKNPEQLKMAAPGLLKSSLASD